MSVDINKAPDQQLIELVSKGDHGAFSVLVKRYTAPLHRFASRTLLNSADADDVVQSMFVKLWQNPSLWNPRKASFSSWGYRVVLNACRDVQRNRVRSTQASTEQLEYTLSSVESEQERAERSESTKHTSLLLHSAIKSLKPAQREVINLRIYGELNQKQTADVVGKSVKAVDALLARAKLNLADRLKNQADDGLIAQECKKNINLPITKTKVFNAGGT